MGRLIWALFENGMLLFNVSGDVKYTVSFCLPSDKWSALNGKTGLDVQEGKQEVTNLVSLGNHRRKS